jgi:hypothetical protein
MYIKTDSSIQKVILFYLGVYPSQTRINWNIRDTGTNIILKKQKGNGNHVGEDSCTSDSLAERGAAKYLQLLDQAADWCTDLGMYIIDWHSIGNLKVELFQDPMYNTTQKKL